MDIASRIRSVPGNVEFGDMECCALRVAGLFHDKFIYEFREKTANVAEPHELRMLDERFTNTLRLAFTPQIIHRRFYLELAHRERERLGAMSVDKLACGHKKEEHIKFLGSVMFLMNQPQGSN